MEYVQLKQLVIMDMVSNNFATISPYIQLLNRSLVIPLTPSSIYYLETNSIEFKKFHSLMTTKTFRNNILKIYEDIKVANENRPNFHGCFRTIAQYLNYFYTIEILLSFIKQQKFNEIIYITDKKLVKDIFSLSNQESSLPEMISFSKIINIDFMDNSFLKKKNIFKIYSPVFLLKKLWNKAFNSDLSYDWLEIKPQRKVYKINKEVKYCYFDLRSDLFKNIEVSELRIDCSILKSKKVSCFNTFLSLEQSIATQKINNNLYFFQHGNYFYKNIFIENSEVNVAKVNFVFNEYTKRFFEDLNGKNVFVVGSNLFQKKIKEKKIEYDFLYITQGHDYLGKKQYVDFPNSLHSFDGYELYQRHKQIIELFGRELNTMKVVIKLHPCILSTGVYSPLWEIAKKFSNVSLDITTPIHGLIESSKYIISDYFTSDFLNREIHYKKNIILFSGAPTPLPSETLLDMKKLFILINSVVELRDKIRTIRSIVKNRVQDSSKIEYYTSKKVDTTKKVKEILLNEFHGR